MRIVHYDCGENRAVTEMLIVETQIKITLQHKQSHHYTYYSERNDTR